MCDVSGVTLGAILGKRKDTLFHLVHYASKTLNVAKKNHIVKREEF
ncbi:hypothetical protein MTR67_044360 [Solanum verrucosum]|uniref:Uncharacterized protein n=1 Tax=Solanum verrucosum TaxID=315347 RepID=A0AAF0ZVK3_SOLVR|nr:hypothetical protein MTR67_044360 [Solanum verrucosum]